ncbi:hypothetical protein BH09PSE2_BH09PSE2_17640 [soil metagenome]
MGVFVFKLPDVGEGTAEAELVEWKVAVGDMVAEDQPLADVMTDKATVELTSPVAGRVRALHGSPGEMRAVKSPLVELDVEGAGGEGSNPGLVPSPSGERNIDPRDTPPTTPEFERPDSPDSVSKRADSPDFPDSVSAQSGDFIFRLPDVGEGTAEAELVEWKVAFGDTVEEDQPLADVMTDKATVELTSPVAGVVTALHGTVGQMLAVKSPLVELMTGKGGAASSPAPVVVQPAAAPAPAAKPATAASTAAASSQPAHTTRVPGSKPLASPAVRRRAHELGVELAYVPGSGPAGRVSHEDLDGFLNRGSTPPPAAAPASGYAKRTEVTDVKVIGLRRRIAQSMQEAKRRIPHFAYIEEVDMTALEALRAHLNATHKERGKLTVLPFLARALVKMLPHYPQINARFDDDAGVVHRHAAVHLGVAAQTPNGLIVPVVKHAEALDLWAFAREVTRLSAAARDGKAKSEELSGSTITLTSLGPLGGIATTPVINYPEVAIIGPNKIVERPVVVGGQVVIRKMMNLSSSFDHRVVDGYDAAEFIQRVKGLLENPAALFIE